MEALERALLEAMLEARHSLHQLLQAASMPRGAYAALFLIDEMNREQHETPGVTISMLGERLRISRPAVTRMVNDLEEQGYVIKLSARQDRRFVYLMLTPDGRAALAQARKSFLKMIGQMGEEDACELLRLLKRISELCHGAAHQPDTDAEEEG